MALHVIVGKGPVGTTTAEEEAPAQEEKEAPAAEEKKDVPPPVTAGEKDGKSGRGDVTHQDLTRLQQTVARRMAESKATAPDFVIAVEVDMEEAVEFRKQLKVAAGDDPAGAGDERAEPGDEDGVGPGALDDRQVGRRALVEVDELVDLRTGQPAGPRRASEQRLEAGPLAGVRGDVRVEVHSCRLGASPCRPPSRRSVVPARDG